MIPWGPRLSAQQKVGTGVHAFALLIGWGLWDGPLVILETQTKVVAVDETEK